MQGKKKMMYISGGEMETSAKRDADLYFVGATDILALIP